MIVCFNFSNRKNPCNLKCPCSVFSMLYTLLTVSKLHLFPRLTCFERYFIKMSILQASCPFMKITSIIPAFDRVNIGRLFGFLPKNHSSNPWGRPGKGSFRWWCIMLGYSCTAAFLPLSFRYDACERFASSSNKPQFLNRGVTIECKPSFFKSTSNSWFGRAKPS